MTIGGPLIDGRDWRTRGLVLEARAGGGSPNAAPLAFASSVCEGATCYFSSAGSGDPDGTLANVAWNFGDGTVGTGSPVSHTYSDEASKTVTLTVTDNNGASHRYPFGPAEDHGVGRQRHGDDDHGRSGAKSLRPRVLGDGGGLDLDHQLRKGQPCHTEQRAGRHHFGSRCP